MTGMRGTISPPRPLPQLAQPEASAFRCFTQSGFERLRVKFPCVVGTKQHFKSVGALQESLNKVLLIPVESSFDNPRSGIVRRQEYVMNVHYDSDLQLW